MLEVEGAGRVAAVTKRMFDGGVLLDGMERGEASGLSAVNLVGVCEASLSVPPAVPPSVKGLDLKKEWRLDSLYDLCRSVCWTPSLGAARRWEALA